jgi:hypothetical protein
VVCSCAYPMAFFPSQNSAPRRSPVPTVLAAFGVLGMLAFARSRLATVPNREPVAPRSLNAVVYIQRVAPVLRAHGCAVAQCHASPNSTFRLTSTLVNAAQVMDEYQQAQTLALRGIFYNRATHAHSGSTAMVEGSCDGEILRSWSLATAMRSCR